MSKIITGTIQAEELIANPWECAARLGVARDYSSELIEACRKRLLDAVECKYAAVELDTEYEHGEVVKMGELVFESRNLFKNLNGAEKAIAFAVTTGISVDRLLMRLKCISSAEYFVTDALASAMAESAAETAQELLRGGRRIRPRFSPGFGDLGLSAQPMLLRALCSEKTVGITLNKALLMTPVKSVTAIMGVFDED